MKMMKNTLKNRIYRRLLPRIGLFLVGMLSSTYKVTIVDPEKESKTLERDNSLIYASWHQRFFPGITFFARRKPIAIMISQSRDGGLIATIVDMLGWEPVRGSSSRGGRSALLKLKKLARKGYKIGHIVDGPKGPFGEVKAGLVLIAQATGLAIVPTITSAERRWQANSWDRFMIPKPFSRVIIRFGEPFYLPREMDEDEFEEKRLEIEKRMHSLYEETDSIWRDPEAIRDIFGSR